MASRHSACTLAEMREPARVVVAGGGFAAVEALLALRELAGPRAELVLVSPKPTLDFRPAATIESFADLPPLRYDLQAIADDVGASYVCEPVAAVAGEARQIRLQSFRRIDYDALVVAIGTQPRAGVPGALTFRDQRDIDLVRQTLTELDMGAIRRLAFAVPAGVSWPLPLYELALLAAARAEELGLFAELALVTPERTPLEALGTQASATVAGLLAERDVRFFGRSVPAAVTREGRLELRSAGSVPADRVIAVPELLGRRVAGVPAGWSGFVPVDRQGRVEGMHDVYAAGDLTTFPLKHGGLATQQADTVARTIAASLGCDVAPAPERSVLQLRLAGGDRPLSLRIELDEDGRPGETELLDGLPDGSDQRVAKVLGRHLSPFLAGRAPQPA
jgi:sulfide:quinone oxidoreductase